MSLNISDFNFLCENCTPPWRNSCPPFSQQLPSKGWGQAKPPFFKFGWRLNPPSPPGVHTAILNETDKLSIFVLICAQDTKKRVLASFLINWKNRVDPCITCHALFGKSTVVYGHFLLDVMTSEGVHPHIILLSIVCILSKISNYKWYATINFIRN